MFLNCQHSSSNQPLRWSFVLQSNSHFAYEQTFKAWFTIFCLCRVASGSQCKCMLQCKKRKKKFYSCIALQHTSKLIYILYLSHRNASKYCEPGLTLYISRITSVMWEEERDVHTWRWSQHTIGQTFGLRIDLIFFVTLK